MTSFSQVETAVLQDGIEKGEIVSDRHKINLQPHQYKLQRGAALLAVYTDAAVQKPGQEGPEEAYRKQCQQWVREATAELLNGLVVICHAVDIDPVLAWAEANKKLRL